MCTVEPLNTVDTLGRTIQLVHCIYVVQADRLQQATVEVEQKKNHLVARCLEQFGEARERLAQLREKEELTSSTNQQLQVTVTVCVHEKYWGVLISQGQ